MVKRRRKPKQPRTTSYRLHRATGQAYVELNGQRIYLGRYDKAATKHKYHQIIAEWGASTRTLKPLGMELYEVSPAASE